MYQITAYKYLNSNELLHLKSNLGWNRNDLIIRLALATGARPQELLNITKSDLYEQSVYIKGLKGSFDRQIPIEKTLYDALIALPLKDSLFNISYPRLVQIWNLYRPNNKPFKSLRHTFAMETIKRTRDIKLVQVALGHVSLINTNVYLEHLYRNEKLKGLICE